MLSKLKSFRGVSKLKLAALNIFIKTLNSDDIDPLRLRFQQMDKDKSGFIHDSELKTALANSGIQIS